MSLYLVFSPTLPALPDIGNVHLLSISRSAIDLLSRGTREVYFASCMHGALFLPLYAPSNIFHTPRYPLWIAASSALRKKSRWSEEYSGKGTIPPCQVTSSKEHVHASSWRTSLGTDTKVHTYGQIPSIICDGDKRQKAIDRILMIRPAVVRGECYYSFVEEQLSFPSAPPGSLFIHTPQDELLRPWSRRVMEFARTWYTFPNSLIKIETRVFQSSSRFKPPLFNFKTRGIIT